MVRVEQADVRWVGARRKNSTQVFWGGGGGVTASPRATGCRIYNRRRCWREPHLLGVGVSRLHFPRGRRVALTDLSRVTNDEPSCSASEEEGELGVFCRSEEEGELGFSVGVR